MKRHRISYLQRLMVLVLVVAIGFVTGCVSGEMPYAKPEAVGMSTAKLGEIVPAAQKLIDDEKIAGAITMVARKGKIVHFEALGMRDIAAGKPMTKDTIVRMYSMSKPVTSVAVMMLVEKGQVRLDDPVAKYIPEFKGLKVYGETSAGEAEYQTQEREMTVRDLLRHSSGLTYGLFSNTPVDQMYRESKIMGSKNLSEMVENLGEIPLLYQPGTKWHYSVSVDVLGYLVEVVSGEKLDEFFEKNIFKPLDMKDSAFYVTQGKRNRFSACYHPDGEGGLKVGKEVASYQFLEPPTFLSGGGGLVSTARDYMRFCQMLLNEGELGSVRILKPETVEMMTQNQLPADVSFRPGQGFGLGFFVQLKEDPRDKNLAHVGEYGWAGAASTQFWISPKDELIVVAIAQRLPGTKILKNAIKTVIYESIMEEATVLAPTK
ncbi:MAG: beta-lactamase family protein [Sedimentisphaerales bacterium]|nr:beta-lactamase family protein [Sedimentisphaerales bacterium]